MQHPAQAKKLQETLDQLNENLLSLSSSLEL